MSKDDLRAMSTDELRAQAKELDSLIFDDDCFSVSDMRLLDMISRELKEREAYLCQ